MSNQSRFSMENILMSVVGHLVLIALLVTSFVVIVRRAQLVTPDRIEITEIDLNNVKITGDKTVLYNVEPPRAPESKKTESVESKKQPAPEIGDDEPIKQPSLVTEKSKKSAEKNKHKETPAPKKKMTVRVNREVVSLDRTMTVSVVDALRVALTRCWVIDSSRADIADIRAVAHLVMYKNGMVRDVWFESAARADTDPAYAYVIETIRSALKTCQPFKMLPPGEFDKWQKIQLTFYPTQGKIL
jgi:hypothetical protein